jgi:4-hydroxybenzoate polyprenyltransferase
MNPKFRTLLVLGRVANLPTVWSNVVAGWWLGGGLPWKLPLLLLGASALHTAGTFLNDAFDADSDRLRRPDRPIPAGKITQQQVWRGGFQFLGIGVLVLSACGTFPALGAVLLALTLLLHGATHKIVITASPWLLGACRFWLYLIAAASGVNGLDGFAVFCGAALAVYSAGIGYAVRHMAQRWPLLLLVAPVAMASVLNTPPYLRDALVVAFLFLLWLGRCEWEIFFSGQKNAPRLGANLVAGIVLADWIAVAPVMPHPASVVTFLALFTVTKFFQKFAPVI